MARFWAGTIGGVELLDGEEVAGFELTGAGAFVNTWTGNTRPGLLGNPHTQYAELNKGRVLELKFIHAPQDLVTALYAVLVPIIPGGTSVECEFLDGFQTIARSFKPHVPSWVERGNPDGDYINDFILRLIETGV